jgi:SAM-dependent methyltransferase
MKTKSLLETRRCSLKWIKDFYTQTEIWWGPDPGEEYYPVQVAAVERLCGVGSKRILELGAGSGGTAAALSDGGHDVTAVELSPVIRSRVDRLDTPRAGKLALMEADFYTVQLQGRFDLVCYWDGFGVGSDRDNRRLLRRIAREWLAPGGSVLMDVFNPFRYAGSAGKEEILPPLPDVPGSVEMLHRTHFDALNCRWIDEWIPTAAPENALSQTIRCYTPGDLSLLLKGTGLTLKRIEVDSQVIDPTSTEITTSGPLLGAFSYLAHITPIR